MSHARLGGICCIGFNVYACCSVIKELKVKVAAFNLRVKCRVNIPVSPHNELRAVERALSTKEDNRALFILAACFERLVAATPNRNVA